MRRNKTRHHGGGGTPTPPPPATYTVTFTTSGTGGGGVTGPGINTGIGDNAQTYPVGTSVSYTATPNGSSDFGGYTGGVSSSSTTISFTVSANVTIDAAFPLAGGTGGGNPDDTGVAAIDNHMGVIKKQDLATAQDPCPGLWISVTDPYIYGTYSSGTPASGDPYVSWLSTAPVDTHVARGQTTTSTRFRRMKADETVQDIYDAGVPNASTRTQCVHNSTTQTFWPGAEGTRYWYMFSHRRHGAGQLATGSYPAQVCQWKAPQPGGGGTQPILAVNEGGSGYQFLWHDWYASGNPKVPYVMPFASNNVWVRFWIDINWSATAANATFSVWSDMNGWPPTRLVGPVTGKRTLFDAAQPSNWSFGIYASPATDLNGILLSDYANLQVCAYV